MIFFCQEHPDFYIFKLILIKYLGESIKNIVKQYYYNGVFQFGVIII